jgi:hypothetical protein
LIVKPRLATTGLAVPCLTVVVTVSLSLPSFASALLPALLSGKVTAALAPAATVNARLPTTTGFGLLALPLLALALAA